MPRKEGQFTVEDFFLNDGGLNTADSPFVVQNNECTGGKNFDYILRGGISKAKGHAKLNTVANAETKSLGLGLFNKPSATRTVIRAAGTKLQAFNTSSFAFTNLTEDTLAAGSAFLSGSSSVPVAFNMFNTSLNGVLWGAGGGMASIYGAYSALKATKNGATGLTLSSFTGTNTGTGGTLAVGSYRYALVARKAGTDAESNASVVEATATVTSGQKVDLAWTATGLDTTKYDTLIIYRSSLSGSAGFTAGAIVAEVASSSTSYTDTGASVSSSESVPRANSLALDNSELPSSTFKAICTYKRRLVTASDSNVYFSDVNKPESWPTVDRFTVPSGGDITGVAVISLTSSLSTDIDEALCIFKQNELWVLTGNTYADYALKYVGRYGATNQTAIVVSEGYLAWLNYKGPFMWTGEGKPIFIGKKIKDKFQQSGDIDKSKLGMAWGAYSERRNEVIWCLSSKTQGEQKYALKLDLNESNQSSSTADGKQEMEGKFTPDVYTFPAYAALSFLPASDSAEELIYLGDATGYIYNGYTAADSAGSAVSLEYITPYYNFGQPNIAKRVSKVVVWVLDTGPYNLSLDYWSNYRFSDADASSITLPISDSLVQSNAVWGAFLWGTGVWGAASNKIRPVTFNLNSSNNNGEGDSVRFKLSQSGTTQTVVIYGFSVYYSELGLRK